MSESPASARAASGAPRVAVEFLRLAVPYLDRHRVGTPRLDAEVLLAHVLGITRLELYARLDQPLSRPEVDAYREALRRRAAREPVAYITGRREFYGMLLGVAPGVLIPRPETEFLVELALREVAPENEVLFADIGTGTGALAVAVASRRPRAVGVGIDVSARALACARANAATHAVGARLSWIQGDGARCLAPRSMDLILSNPPYIPTARLNELEPEIRCFEPRNALDGGPDGLGVARRFAGEAGRVLREGGLLLMELGEQGQARRLAAECTSRLAFASAEVIEDEVTRIPVLAARAARPAAPSDERGQA